MTSHTSIPLHTHTPSAVTQIWKLFPGQRQCPPEAQPLSEHKLDIFSIQGSNTNPALGQVSIKQHWEGCYRALLSSLTQPVLSQSSGTQQPGKGRASISVCSESSGNLVLRGAKINPRIEGSSAPCCSDLLSFHLDEHRAALSSSSFIPIMGMPCKWTLV